MNGDGDSFKGQFLKVVADPLTGKLTALNDGDDTNDSQSHQMLKDGLGIMHYQNESVYEGYWIMGVRHGNGRLIHRNGDCFQGEWKDDQANGFGKFTNFQGYKYEGEWLNDC